MVELDRLMNDIEHQKHELEKRKKLLEEYNQNPLANYINNKMSDKNKYEMYLIREKSFKIQVPCKNCADRGYINKSCQACNGKGIHNKTFSSYIVRERIKEIVKIDRDSKTGELRYWEDMSCYYEEISKLVHFNKKDAKEECDKRNIGKYGFDFYNQYLR